MMIRVIVAMRARTSYACKPAALKSVALGTGASLADSDVALVLIADSSKARLDFGSVLEAEPGSDGAAGPPDPAAQFSALAVDDRDGIVLDGTLGSVVLFREFPLGIDISVGVIPHKVPTDVGIGAQHEFVLD